MFSTMVTAGAGQLQTKSIDSLQMKLRLLGGTRKEIATDPRELIPVDQTMKRVEKARVQLPSPRAAPWSTTMAAVQVECPAVFSLILENELRRFTETQ